MAETIGVEVVPSSQCFAVAALSSVKSALSLGRRAHFTVNYTPGLKG